MAMAQLVDIAGLAKTPDGYLLGNYPWIYIGGQVSTLTSSTGTGACTYYGLDNTSVGVLKLGCYENVTLAPVIEEHEYWHDNTRRVHRQLNGFTATLLVTQDLVDLDYLRRFLRQPSEQRCEDVDAGVVSLNVGAMVFSQDFPVLFEQHYLRDGSSEDQYIGILCFQCELALGDIVFDPNEGWRAELTIDVEYSKTYDGFFCIMRQDALGVSNIFIIGESIIGGWDVIG